MAQQRRTVYFSGTVQGVGFRYTTEEVAREFAVAGYVRNLSDGRVEVVAEGSLEELDLFFQGIRDSPVGRYIEDAKESREPAKGGLGPGFSVRY